METIDNEFKIIKENNIERLDKKTKEEIEKNANKLFNEYIANPTKQKKQKIIIENMNLVKYFIEHFDKNNNIPKEELESYAYEGLINAIDNYKPQNNNFISYASQCINCKIKNGLTETAGFKRNKYQQQVKKVYDNSLRDLKEELEYIKNDQKKLLLLFHYMIENGDSILNTKGKNLSFKCQAKKLNLLNELLIMNAKSYEQLQEFEFSQEIKDTNNLHSEQAEIEILESNIFLEEVKEKLMTLMDSCLEEKEKNIIIKLYYEYPNKKKKYEIVANEYRIDKRRVYLTEMKALRKLKTNICKGNELDTYMDILSTFKKENIRQYESEKIIKKTK